MNTLTAVTLLLAGLGASVVGPACANPLKSLYTTIELKDCQVVKKGDDGAAWLCGGIEGYPVYVAEGDLRTFVSVGKAPEKRRAATQTLKAFNSLFKKGSKRAILEWRIVRRNGRPVPFATIQRYYTSRGALRGEVLVVTRVTEDEECHVAYIDALANPNAIALARSVADEKARRFSCRSDPMPVGQSGRSPM
jgi:hypothetical protein